MTKRKPKIIQEKKKRGQWAESVFMARATEHGLPVGRPWGEMCSYDFIIGRVAHLPFFQLAGITPTEGAPPFAGFERWEFRRITPWDRC